MANLIELRNAILIVNAENLIDDEELNAPFDLDNQRRIATPGLSQMSRLGI